jgi:hydrogenase nickel incorporation protein HypB
MSQARAIKLEADVLGENKRLAELNRAHFASHGVTAWNLVSSPGSGKTTLLCATIEALKARAPGRAVAVIEGDQQTSNDADRIRATGAPAIQVNTGKGCHLDAQMVADAFNRLDLHGHAHHDHDHGHDHTDHHHDHDGPLLFIENVGNLVCPAMWDLGEAAKVAILSVTEGEDKPIKYPDMFAAATLMVLNKTDLLPHLDFDVPKCIEYAQRVNPGIEVLLVSARTGQGMDAWLDWLLEAAHANAHHHHDHHPA